MSPSRGGYFIDCTLGGGGYTSALSQIVGPKGKILAIDLDEGALKNAAKKNLKNIILVLDNFKNLPEIIKKEFKEGTIFDGIVLDLGLSSYQLKDRSRGFSFRKAEQPLNMSFSTDEDKKNLTRKIVNKSSKEELERIILKYGEERWAKRIAEEIVKTRRKKEIETVGELVQVVEKIVPKKYSKIHPATKTFQALRIATNKELENLELVLPQAVDFLKSDGRIAVISFHSLEDRIVKNFFKNESRDCLCPPVVPVCACGHKKTLKIITKKPILPGKEEIDENPKARSAKMRVAEKI